MPAQRRPAGVSNRALRLNFFTPRSSVQWFAPAQLARTGLQVALSEGIGAYLDKREQQLSFPDEAFREDGGDELWLDYAADTGDGFHATYAVAYSLGREQLIVKGVPGHLPRGQVLVLGGDEVYPTPSQVEYDDRFRGPFQAALPDVPPGQARPTMYALPGNHDWYDGLTAFLRVFTGARSTIGGWVTRQKRSYFAIKLPQNWWLFAVDAQQGAHIDDPQLEYFHRIINESLADGDRIILCTPEPAWVQGDRDHDAYRATDYFLRKVVEPAGQEEWLREAYRGQFVPPSKRLTVPLMLSGDWHHYTRYERDDPDGATPWAEEQDGAATARDRQQLVTCGGGGAYLLGTQYLPRTITTPPRDLRPPKSEQQRRYRRRSRYPSMLRSFWLGLAAPIRLPWRNPGFIALAGLMQSLLWYAWARSEGRPTFSVVALVLLVIAATIFLAAGLGSPSRNRVRIVLFGLLHAAAQILGVRAAMVPLVRELWQPTLPRPTAALKYNWPVIEDYLRYYGEWLGWYVAYGVVAGLASAIVVGLYLVMASLFRLNINELFSSQRIEGYKSFVRLHIAPGGELTAYVIGLRRVRRLLPRWRWLHWKANPRGAPHEPWFLPRRRLRYKLIDSFTIR